MGERGGEVIFRREDVALFSRVSRDASPLHVDPDHARRTPFGACVVQGMLGVLEVLRGALRGRPVELRTVTARFLRPIFLDTRHPVSFESRGEGRGTALLGSSESPCLRVELEYALAERAWPPVPSGARVEGREAGDLDPASPGLLARTLAGSYELGPDAAGALEALGLAPGSLPPAQIAVLLWVSAFVGMEAPGRGALLRSVAIEFPATGRSVGDTSALAYEARVEAYQPECSLFTLSAKLRSDGGAFARARITAARRPLPIEPSLERLEALAGRSEALSGQRALVTGSSRGLGALLALGCALHGADVILHARDGVRDAERIGALVSSLGRKTRIVAGDIRSAETWREAASAADALGGLDVLVHCACPALAPSPFLELPEETVNDLVCGGIRAACAAFRTFLPHLVRSRGCLVNVSSAAALRGRRELALEATLKAAVDGLVVVLAAEHRGVKFVTARPPRMLTDRTNEIIPAFRPRGAEGVAARIVRSIVEPLEGTNHAVLDGFD